jgi:glycosyltransferase involved in cell wall biosynthesis
MNLLSIFIITFNEQKLLPYTVAFYRERFPGCQIVIYDNFSDDETVNIALELGCKVKYFYTDNKLSDQAFINVKNNCWKTTNSEWVVVCDCDEWIDIWPKTLEQADGTILRTYYVQMVGFTATWNPMTVTHGYRHPEDSKFLCFKPSAIEAMEYNYGAHYALPFGDVKITKERFPIYHFKFITLYYVLERHAMFGKRLSAHNLRLKLSFHYLFSTRKIKREYQKLCKKAVKIF